MEKQIPIAQCAHTNKYIYDIRFIFSKNKLKRTVQKYFCIITIIMIKSIYKITWDLFRNKKKNKILQAIPFPIYTIVISD